jgi:hypothetical protein
VDNREAAARLIVVERAIVDLAVLVERLRQDLLDSDPTHVVVSTHDRTDV